MNQLEHLRALRDKARVQTEQARAVLKQQTEITESLDRLIADLEGNPAPEPTPTPQPVSLAESGNKVGTLGKMIADLESSQSQAENDPEREEVVWEEAPKPDLPEMPKKPRAEEIPPKLDPIVWEVAESSPIPSSQESEGETSSSNSNNDEPAVSEEALAPKEFEFTKLGDPESESKVTGHTMPIPVGELLKVSSPAKPVAATINEPKDRAVEAPSESPEPTPPVDVEPDELESETIDASTEETPETPETPVASNIFFDANSAYLKESELTKLRITADLVDNGTPRLVKIQGLEDLASSNDFKELLSSRRLLAVKKRLAENEIQEDQIAISEIRLTEEGRILSPPSILVSVRTG